MSDCEPGHATALRQMYEARAERDALRWENEELRKALSGGAVQRVLQTRAENRTLRAEVEQLRSEVEQLESDRDYYQALYYATDGADDE